MIPIKFAILFFKHSENNSILIKQKAYATQRHGQVFFKRH